MGIELSTTQDAAMLLQLALTNECPFGSRLYRELHADKTAYDLLTREPKPRDKSMREVFRELMLMAQTLPPEQSVGKGTLMPPSDVVLQLNNFT